MKQQFSDREPGRDMPYGDTENPRPETNALIAQTAAMSKPKTKAKKRAKRE